MDTFMYLFIYLFIYFLINFIISAEMTSFSLDDEGQVDLLYLEGSSFSSSLSPLVTLFRKYVSLAYSLQFLLFFTSFTSYFFLPVGYVVSMSLFKVTIHKTKHRKA